MNNDRNNVVPFSSEGAVLKEAQDNRAQERIKRAVRAYKTVTHAERELDRKVAKMHDCVSDLRGDELLEYARITAGFDRELQRIAIARMQKRGEV